MPAIPVAENVFGTIGTICWTGQLIPQVWKSYREKSTEGLSHWLVFSWGCGATFLGIYAVTQNLNIPLIIQPQLFGFLSLVSWTQCLYYEKRYPLRRCLLILAATLIVLGGFEAGMVFAIRPAFRRGNDKPVTFFGVFSAISISFGLLPQYYEIKKHKEVKGISLPFITIDLLGGIFSDLSLVFKDKFDVLAAVTYSLVVVLDGVVVIAALILNPRAERRRRAQADAIAAAEIANEANTTQEPAEMTGVSTLLNTPHSTSRTDIRIDNDCDTKEPSTSALTSTKQSRASGSRIDVSV